MTTQEYRQAKSSIAKSYAGREHTTQYRDALTNLASIYGARVVRLAGNRYRLQLLRRSR